MAHQYDNFAAAYSALRTEYSAANDDYDESGEAWLRWQEHHYAGEYPQSTYDLAHSVRLIRQVLTHILSFTGYGASYSLLCENIYWANADAGAGAVDMSAILDAMSKAEPHQPLLFVGYLEAYYASVWNASFDEGFYADLVKKWSIWD